MQIIGYIMDMLPYMLLSLPFIAIWRIVAVHLMKRKNRKTTTLHEVGLILFVLFIVGLASQTVIPKLVITQNGIGISDYYLSAANQLNLIPFKVFPETYTALFINHHFNYGLINFLGNIIMFMPIGFFVPLLWENISIKKATFIGFVASFTIEVLQIPFARGTDIDDLWLNTLGTILGFLVYKLLRQQAEIVTAKFKTKAF
ncbi:MAG: VanZ family protein [Oscillospiraceae bacterium]|nr:VanZ family protein [Oscillospiraceae bacterium]